MALPDVFWMTLPASIAAIAALVVGILNSQVLKKTHALVNSNMGIQLNINRVTTSRLADVTKSPADITAAQQAEGLYQEHMRKQAIADGITK